MIEALQRRAVILELEVILADFNVLGGLVRVPRLQDSFVFGRGSRLFFAWVDIGVNLRVLAGTFTLYAATGGIGAGRVAGEGRTFIFIVTGLG